MLSVGVGDTLIPMTLGVTWPLPWPLERLDRFWLDALKKESGLSRLRVNLDSRNPLASKAVRDAENAGFKVLPIFDLDYFALMQPGAFEQRWWADHLRFVHDMTVQHRFSHIENMNEPDTPILDARGITRQRIDPHTYARVCNAVGEAVHRARPETKVIVATELFRADRKGPKKRKGRYWQKLRSGLMKEHVDWATAHPYRDPGRPQLSRFGKPWRWWGNGTRQAEWEYMRRETRGWTPVVTEVGWDLPRLNWDYALQARYVSEEVEISRALEIEMLMLYAFRGEYGLLNDDRSARLAAHVVRDLAA